MAQNRRQQCNRHSQTESDTIFNQSRIGGGSYSVVRCLSIISCVFLMSACAGVRTVDQSVGHVSDEALPDSNLEPIVDEPQQLPEPVPLPPVETYTVVVKEVPVIDLLFSLATDAGLDLDIQADSERTITLNAVNQPLPNILSRIADQAGLRFVLSANNLIIQEDLPYWHNYIVDYVNVSRTAIGEVGVATQIATSGGTVAEETSGGSSDDNGNLSKTTVTSRSSNDFWATVESSLASIIRSAGGEGASPTTPDAFTP